MPDYWKHLNENPQVWVSAVDQFAVGYGSVDQSLSNLIIRGQKAGTYNVLLVGTRKDDVAKEYFDTLGVEFQASEKEGIQEQKRRNEKMKKGEPME